MELPQFVKELNKKKGAIKITTLNEAKAFNLKRFFSGSFIVDYMAGGGFAYRRIHLLFGSKSAGKNALLNQTVAYMQRQCKTCGGVLSEFVNNDGTISDTRASVLHSIMGIPICECSNPVHKQIFILDYEKSLALENPRSEIVRQVIISKTGEEVSSDEYDKIISDFNSLSEKEKLTDKETEKIKEYELFLKSVSIKEKTIEKLSSVDYLIKCGIFPERLLVADPEDTEEGIEMVNKAIRSKELDMIIWDSLQAAIPRYVKDRNADQSTMGVEAKQNGLFMRHVCSSFAANDLTDETEAYKPALFIASQVRSNFNVFVSGPDTYSGGNAIQHHIAFALEVKRMGFLREDGTDADFKDHFFGQKVRLRTDKNKLSTPGDMFEYDYYFRDGKNYSIGIDNIGELINLASKINLFDQAGTWYMVDGKKIQGLRKLSEYYRENVDATRKLYMNIMNSL